LTENVDIDLIINMIGCLHDHSTAAIPTSAHAEKLCRSKRPSRIILQLSMARRLNRIMRRRARYLTTHRQYLKCPITGRHFKYSRLAMRYHTRHRNRVSVAAIDSRSMMLWLLINRILSFYGWPIGTPSAQIIELNTNN